MPTHTTKPGSLKEDLEFFVQTVATVLTVSQLCADWFALREFRLTSTSAASLLLKCSEYREWMNLPVSEVEPPSPSEILASLSRGRFRFGRATEDMRRGTMNEDAVLVSFHRSGFVRHVSKVGMLCRKSEPCIGCSVDGIAIFDGTITVPEMANSTDDIENCIAIVEIKTVVGSATVARATQLACPDLIVCEINSAPFQERIPQEHAAQILHHCTTLNTTCFFYIATSESQVLFTVLSRCPTALSNIVRSFYSSSVTPALIWARAEPTEQQPPTRDKDTDSAISSRIPFWKMLNTGVISNGPLVPVRIFKHSSQTIYIKAKGGVDGNAQMRALLQCPTDTLKWEQKVVTQVFKSIAVNSWVAWRQLQKEDLLISKESFKGLEQYRNALNKIESFPDFVFEVTQELFTYAHNLERDESNNISQREIRKDAKIKKPEMRRLIRKAKARKRYKLEFLIVRKGFRSVCGYKGTTTPLKVSITVLFSMVTTNHRLEDTGLVSFAKYAMCIFV